MTCANIQDVPLIIRREIEALMAVPLIKGYIEELGRDKALAIAARIVRSLALESGQALAALAGGDSLEKLAGGLSMFSQGGALEMEMLEQTEDRLSWDVKRCKYAEMYKAHGLEDFGVLLSCGRDYALFEGFNSQIQLDRTKTIMEGGDVCDFRLSLKKP